MICGEGHRDFPEEAGHMSSWGDSAASILGKNLGKIQGGLIQACPKQAGATGQGAVEGRWQWRAGGDKLVR